MRFHTVFSIFLTAYTAAARPMRLPNGQDVQLDEAQMKQEWDAFTSQVGSRWASAFGHHTRHRHHHTLHSSTTEAASVTSSVSAEPSNTTSAVSSDPTSADVTSTEVITSTITATSTSSESAGFSTSSVASSTSIASKTSSSTRISSSVTQSTTTQSVTSTQSTSSASHSTVSSSSSVASTTASSSSSTASSVPTASAFQLSYLTPHNTIRAAKHAPALQWNNTLATFAKEWASNCVFNHSSSPYGENLAAGTGSYGTAAAGVKLWTDEESKYDPSNPVASHYTQVVWKDSTQIGCAVAVCNDLLGANTGAANYQVCEYYPAGNVVGQFAANVEA